MRVGVIGGGVAGLTIADELARAGHEVAVFEKWGQLGGAVYTFRIADTRLECFYHHLFAGDRYAVDLLDDLGLSDRLRWYDSKVGFFNDGRIYPFVTPGDLLRFTPLPLLDRIRLGLVGLYLRRRADYQRYEDVTARDWIRRYAGERIYNTVWGPLLNGKFGNEAANVGMVWFWGKIFVRFASRAGLRQREKLGYIHGGFSTMTDALAERIRAHGGTLHVGQPVQSILVEDGRVVGLEVKRVRGRLREEQDKASSNSGPTERHLFDAVVCTAPSYELARMAPEITGDYAERLNALRYQAAVVMVFVLRRSLSPIYWLNMSDLEMPFVAAIEHTNFIPPEEYGGRHILYLSNYVAQDDPLVRMRPDEVLARFVPALQRINPEFDPSWVERRYLFKDEAAQPIVTPGYGRRILEHRTPITGLYLANTSQIYPEDRGSNYSIRLGQTAARLVLDDAARLRSTTPVPSL